MNKTKKSFGVKITPEDVEQKPGATKAIVDAFAASNQ